MQQATVWRLVAPPDMLLLSRRQQQPQHLQQAPPRLGPQPGQPRWQHQGLLGSLLLQRAATHRSWQLG